MRSNITSYSDIDGNANFDGAFIGRSDEDQSRPLEVMKENCHLLEKGFKGRPQSTTPHSFSQNFSPFLLIAVVMVISISGLSIYVIKEPVAMGVMYGVNIPYEAVSHPMQPSSYWGSVSKPYPTGAFWTNLVVDNQAGQINSPVAVYPYGISCTDGGVQVSYGATRRVTTQLQITDPFAVDIQIGSQESVKAWSVANFDKLSVTMKFDTEQGGSFTNYIVKSSPYVTVVFNDATPVIGSNVMKIISANKKNVQGKNGTYYHMTLGNYQNWFVYCSESVDFRLVGDSLVSPTSITGFVRVGILPAQHAVESFDILAKYVECYPTGVDVSVSYASDLTTAAVRFLYHTKGNGELLMLALPHHLDIMRSPEMNGLDTLKSKYSPVYSIKGKMTPIIAKEWILSYEMKTAGWNYFVEEDLSIGQLNSIADALQADVQTGLPDAEDPYSFGKQIGRLSRLAFIADYLGIPNALSTAIASLETSLTPWLTSSNPDTFLYDETYGGIVSKNGLQNSAADYGNGWYNDHHFQYGYFVYSFAALARYDPSYFSQYRPSMDAIMRDICSMETDGSDFPSVRHKDYFDGHSWASGLFTESNAKNQESSSEAVNSYYACYLYAMATGDTKRMQFMQLLYNMEIQATKVYWHMSDDTIYDPIFAANTMVGNVGALSVTASTWFGNNPQYVHGINIIPVTPVTALLFDRPYVSIEWSVLGYFLPNMNISSSNPSCDSNPGCLSLGLQGDCCPAVGGTFLACCAENKDVSQEEWIGFMYADQAIINGPKAWSNVMMGNNYGPGDSKTNLLFWSATRVKFSEPIHVKIEKVNFNQTIRSSCAHNSACYAQGLEGDCCPSSGGVMLECCPTVQYPLASF